MASLMLCCIFRNKEQARETHRETERIGGGKCCTRQCLRLCFRRGQRWRGHGRVRPVSGLPHACGFAAHTAELNRELRNSQTQRTWFCRFWVLSTTVQHAAQVKTSRAFEGLAALGGLRGLARSGNNVGALIIRIGFWGRL